MEKIRSNQFQALTAGLDRQNLSYKVVENPSPELLERIFQLMKNKAAKLGKPSLN